MKNIDIYCESCGEWADYTNMKLLVSKEHRNIRTVSALEKIFENLSRIPIEELEKLGDKYGL